MTQRSATPERVGPLSLLRPRRKAPWPIEFYRSAVGKKWVMALTGIALLGFVLAHLVGNLKLYLSKEDMNLYGEALRDLGGHLVPRSVTLWILRGGLIAAFALHLHAAYTLTRLNHRARPVQYRSRRDYVAANFASRTMRWTGVIVFAYLGFHLADLTWGSANPHFLRGDPYNNLIYSLQRPAVALSYAVANIALGVHLLHGVGSLFQSLGVSNPRIAELRTRIAQGFTAVVVLGNLSFPLLVQLHVVESECPGAEPTQPCDEQSPGDDYSTAQADSSTP